MHNIFDERYRCHPSPDICMNLLYQVEAAPSEIQMTSVYARPHASILYHKSMQEVRADFEFNSIILSYFVYINKRFDSIMVAFDDQMRLS